tara:strand:+ start:4985 stop:5194 length:210 start_codon:yes stop_codon:yes gene_type:complete
MKNFEDLITFIEMAQQRGTYTLLEVTKLLNTIGLLRNDLLDYEKLLKEGEKDSCKVLPKNDISRFDNLN